MRTAGRRWLGCSLTDRRGARITRCPADTPTGGDSALGGDDFDRALETINDSDYGLQAGLFVRDIHKIQRAWDRLEVGGVMIGEIPSWRVDHMPYGGVKDSGLGREGIRFAMEEMTEVRLLAIRTPE